MTQPLDERYFKWLYKHSGMRPKSARDPRPTYWKLFKILYTTEFEWFVPNDDNRHEDGRNLRGLFLNETGVEGADQDWLDQNCSMLEMLIALSARCWFADWHERAPNEWLWTMLKNVGLQEFHDGYLVSGRGDLVEEIKGILKQINNRTYAPDGSRGGLFPLEKPTKDQRHVEIWYQMHDYLNERS
jgi:hypothetical protein